MRVKDINLDNILSTANTHKSSFILYKYRIRKDQHPYCVANVRKEGELDRCLWYKSLSRAYADMHYRVLSAVMGEEEGE